MLRLQIGSRVVPGNCDGSSRSLRHDSGLLSGLHERPRVKELAREALNEQRQVQVLRVRSMQQSNRKSVIEELWIDAIASVDGKGLQLVDVGGL
jgi:hypothetical protein